jgi:formylglycine-generating enzyme required for sulfatase activity
MNFVLIPAGKFQMGSPEYELDRDPDETLHTVIITKPFYLGMNLVTQAQVNSVLSTTSRDTSSLPAVNISYQDVQAFCAKLSMLSGEGDTKWKYRLPTEAEWEYACRAGTRTAFSFGNQCGAQQANCNGFEPYGAIAPTKYLMHATPIGSYMANGFGLFDMHGNVWEWCNDSYGQYDPKVIEDPTGPAQGRYRVIRGGSYLRAAYKCRSAQRDFESADAKALDL